MLPSYSRAGKIKHTLVSCAYRTPKVELRTVYLKYLYLYIYTLVKNLDL